ncbi:MAG: hypothetical protein V4772_00305 [Pseudomonadota bacterium]
MTTINTTSRVSSSSLFTPVNDGDFVSSDMAALASHMDDCAHSRGRFFGLQTAFESAHSLLFARLVTAALMAVTLFGLVSAI